MGWYKDSSLVKTNTAYASQVNQGIRSMFLIGKLPGKLSSSYISLLGRQMSLLLMLCPTYAMEYPFS